MLKNNVNRFGLKRYIPSDVARAVRQRCGFGCVVCGSAIYDYEHFHPEFKDAKVHNPSGIILLCPNHHRAKGGFISLSTLQKYAASPFCKSSGFSHTRMDVNNLAINAGPFTAEHCLTVLEIKSKFFIDIIATESTIMRWMPAFWTDIVIKAIWFEPPEEEGAPLRLNLVVNGPNRERLAWIDNNVWHGSAQNFDIVTTSGKESSRIKVTEFFGRTVLDLEFLPPNEVNVRGFFSYYDTRSVEITGDKSGGTLKINDKVLMHGSGCYSGYSNVAVSL